MPHKDPAARAAYRARYDKAHRPEITKRKRNQRHAAHKPFVGFDGEGGDINGRHEYLHLRTGDRVLETGKPLTTVQCLRFLTDLPAGNEYVGYFITYDITMILRDLPADVMNRLLDRERRAVLGEPGVYKRVWWNNYGMDWIPGKEFRVCRFVNGRKPVWTVISDVGAFFQCSFVTALKRWNVGTPELLARIAAQKSRRSTFTTMTDLTRLYCKKECDLLAELMESFRAVVSEVGPHPLRWQGPGDLAAAWLRWHEVPSEQNVPTEAMRLARDAYYGGRFEITAVGPIRRTIYQYDINSAYPAQLRGLPCLVHGTWIKRPPNYPFRRNALFVSRVTFYHPAGRLGTLPVRANTGSISYPRTGRGVYWSAEIRAAKRAGCQVDIGESWEYVAHCECRPFEWVGDLYAYRRRVGKTNKGNAIKLVLNSLYGKMAQSVGQPKWANPVYAGLITANTRALIIDACKQVPARNVLMIATDGIFTDEPLSLPIGSNLGEWEATEHGELFVIQPGLYMLPGTSPKTRGIPQGKLGEHGHRIRKAWQDGIGTRLVPSYRVDLVRFRAAREANHQGKWNVAGNWYTQSRVLSFDWKSKRHPTRGWWDGPAFRPDIIHGEYAESIPYDKAIGLWHLMQADLLQADDDDQPEGADRL